MWKGTPITCHLQLAWQNKYACLKGDLFFIFSLPEAGNQKEAATENEGTSKACFLDIDWTEEIYQGRVQHK